MSTPAAKVNELGEAYLASLKDVMDVTTSLPTTIELLRGGDVLIQTLYNVSERFTPEKYATLGKETPKLYKYVPSRPLDAAPPTTRLAADAQRAR